MIPQTEAVLARQKYLKNIPGWKDVPVEWIRLIQEFLDGYNAFEQKPAIQRLSQAVAVHGDPELSEAHSPVASFKTAPISGRLVDRLNNYSPNQPLDRCSRDGPQ
jgi:hypothetical protein